MTDPAEKFEDPVKEIAVKVDDIIDEEEKYDIRFAVKAIILISGLCLLLGLAASVWFVVLTPEGLGKSEHSTFFSTAKQHHDHKHHHNHPHHEEKGPHHHPHPRLSPSSHYEGKGVHHEGKWPHPHPHIIPSSRYEGNGPQLRYERKGPHPHPHFNPSPSHYEGKGPHPHPHIIPSSRYEGKGPHPHPHFNHLPFPAQENAPFAEQPHVPKEKDFENLPMDPKSVHENDKKLEEIEDLARSVMEKGRKRWIELKKQVNQVSDNVKQVVAELGRPVNGEPQKEENVPQVEEVPNKLA